MKKGLGEVLNLEEKLGVTLYAAPRQHGSKNHGGGLFLSSLGSKTGLVGGIRARK